MDCNLILVSFDTLRADHLGAYGYWRNTSPNIDDFAKKSFVFTNCTSQAPWTLSSHMSLLTGLYSSNHGVIKIEEKNRLDDSTITLADALHDRGYATAAYTGGGYVSKIHNYHTFDVFDESGWPGGGNFNEMVDWIRTNKDKRFFMFYHDFQVHAPYNPPKEYDIFTDAGYSGPVDVTPGVYTDICKGEDESCTLKCGRYYEKIKDNLTSEDIEYIRGKYDGDILTADSRFGALIRFLEEEGLLDNTVIVFVSDHGESLLDREHRSTINHNILYEEVLHVPLIVRVPGHTDGARIGSVTELVDVMPTLLYVLDIPQTTELDGVNLFSPDYNDRKGGIAYSEYFAKSSDQDYSIKVRGKKMIEYRRENKTEFYDLSNDLGEKEDLSQEGNAEINRLRGLLEGKTKKTREVGNASLDNKTVKFLRELGYLD